MGKNLEKLSLLCITDGNVKWHIHCETVWQFLKKLNTKLPCNPAILLLGIYLKELKTET